jgi:hypothetical protein
MKRNTNIRATIWRYAGNPACALGGVLILACFFLAGCLNPLNPPDTGASGNTGGPAAKGLVRLYIGEETAQARTIQPAADAVAGYQLTFSGGPAHEPVDFTGNSVDIYLADGSYTITAKAYKAGGTIGYEGYAAASGSITITLDGGDVTSNGGVVPPIILEPIGTNTGTLLYSITSTAAVSGTIKLWQINGTTPVYGFGTSGVFTIEASPSLSGQTYTLSAGRYITEIRLENVSGEIAVLREVVVIWPGTSTAIVFEPTIYLDPNAVPANSGAVLSSTSTIGGAAIGTGTGGGTSEANPVSYTLAVSDITDAPQVFAPESGSLGAVISWTANTGDVPGGTGYGVTEINDFSVNNVLWVKVMSEDQSTTRYYKFTMIDLDLIISGNGSYSFSGDNALRVLSITGNGTYTISMKSGVTTTTRNRIAVASGVTANITISDVKIDMSAADNNAAFDMAGATVTLTLNGDNDFISGKDKAGLHAPAGSNLTITAEDTTHELFASANAAAGSQGAGIGGGYRNHGGTITINGGTVSAVGGQGGGAGIGSGGSGNNSDAYSGGTLTINGGVVHAAGAYRSAGIGGGNGGSYASGGHGGTVIINGGMVYATGASQSADIGGGSTGLGPGGSGATITINGGYIVANGSRGIGGGSKSGSYVNGGPGTITRITGNAVIVATSIEPALPTGADLDGAIVRVGVGSGAIGMTGTMYGNVTLPADVTISTGHTLDLLGVLTIPLGVTMTNNGTIYNRGAIVGSIVGSGTIVNCSPGLIPSDGSFTDTDADMGQIGGTISWEAPASATTIGIQGYHVYWGQSGGAKLAGNDGVVYDVSGATAESHVVTADTVPPTNAVSFLVYSYNQYGDSGNCLVVPIIDSRSLSGTYGAFTVTGTGGVSYAASLLTIGANGSYVISGTSTTDRIKVAAGLSSVNITFNGLSIDVASIDHACAFDMTGAQVQLTLTGTNILKSGSVYLERGGMAGLQTPAGSTLTITGTGSLEAKGSISAAGIGGGSDGDGGIIMINGGTVTARGGSYGAGIGGGEGGSGGTVTISGGTVTATGWGSGAGIGGGSGGSGGTVTINGGTVTATGSSYGAGIGGGSGGSGGTVTISGGTVTAGGGSNSAAGIGGGESGAAGTITALSGNAVVFASSIQPTLTAGVNATQAIAFNGKTGTMYGNVTLQQDVTIPSTYMLNLFSSQTLTIPGEVTLTNDGTINKNGGTISGTVGGTGTVNN